MAWNDGKGSTDGRDGDGAWRMANGGDRASGGKEKGIDELADFDIAYWYECLPQS